MSPARSQENVFAVFETLKTDIGESSQDATELQDLTLQSAEAICEVIRRLITAGTRKDAKLNFKYTGIFLLWAAFNAWAQANQRSLNIL